MAGRHHCSCWHNLDEIGAGQMQMALTWGGLHPTLGGKASKARQGKARQGKARSLRYPFLLIKACTSTSMLRRCRVRHYQNDKKNTTTLCSVCLCTAVTQWLHSFDWWLSLNEPLLLLLIITEVEERFWCVRLSKKISKTKSGDIVIIQVKVTSGTTISWIFPLIIELI